MQNLTSEECSMQGFKNAQTPEQYKRQQTSRTALKNPAGHFCRLIQENFRHPGNCRCSLITSAHIGRHVTSPLQSQGPDTQSAGKVASALAAAVAAVLSGSPHNATGGPTRRRRGQWAAQRHTQRRAGAREGKGRRGRGSATLCPLTAAHLWPRTRAGTPGF